ncbi:hypothetical protein [Methanococcoides sp. NM1]|uniref:hypothetical protein n=1 Tax=Methanococcoides sp. NM1 TaxID=1201013 RepID=UPI001438402C|nr:hypothetical protein [Methanococcoides sp. NM1]
MYTMDDQVISHFLLVIYSLAISVASLGMCNVRYIIPVKVTAQQRSRRPVRATITTSSV